jgi:hypothetical protein
MIQNARFLALCEGEGGPGPYDLPGGIPMAKNKNQKQPPKSQTRGSSQEQSKGSSEPSSESTGQSPSPMDLAHKSKSRKFGHN